MYFWTNNILKNNYYHTLNSLCFSTGSAAETDGVHWFDEFLVFFFFSYLIFSSYKKIVLFI
jgi:hypothetical protein